MPTISTINSAHLNTTPTSEYVYSVTQDKLAEKNYHEIDPDVFYFSRISRTEYFCEPILNQIMSKKSFSNKLENQTGLLEFANDIFKGSNPMTGEEYDILEETLRKGFSSEPNINGML